MSVGFVLVATFSVLLGIVTYYLWIWTYWMRKGVPGPRGRPFVGVLDVLLEHNNPGFIKLVEWTKKYGKVYGYTDGAHKTLVVADPAMAHEILVKRFDTFHGRKLNPIQGNPENEQRVHLLAAQGYRWKRLRTISSQSFSNACLRKMMGTVEDSALELLRHIGKNTSRGEQIDMLQFYQEYTLDVIGRVAMGQTDTQMFKNPMLSVVKEIFCGSRKNLMLLCQVFPPIGYLVRSLTFKFPNRVPAFKLHRMMQDVVSARIAQREREQSKGVEPGEPHDFVDLFLNARSDDVDFSQEAREDFSRRNLKVTKELSADEVVGQCFLFLIGGFDTTALSLSYVTFLLATNTKCQQKLQEEVDREFGASQIEFDKLKKLKYMDMVFKETLRLYPLASISNSRKCMKTTTVNGVKIEAGVHVQIDTWSLHYDAEIWGDDVNEFKPERWASPLSSEDCLEHKGAYLPFGLGPRQCIGMRLAIMEQKVVLAHILRKYTFEIGSRTRIPLKLVGSATTSPQDVYVHLRPRDL